MRPTPARQHAEDVAAERLVERHSSRAIRLRARARTSGPGDTRLEFEAVGGEVRLQARRRARRSRRWSSSRTAVSCSTRSSRSTRRCTGSARIHFAGACRCPSPASDIAAKGERGSASPCSGRDPASQRATRGRRRGRTVGAREPSLEVRQAQRRASPPGASGAGSRSGTTMSSGMCRIGTGRRRGNRAAITMRSRTCRLSAKRPAPLRPFELFVGLRYTRAKRRTHFISFISLISMLGIALGIAALITVMSVMNGFEKEIRARILGAAAHIQILGPRRGLRATGKASPRQRRRNPEVIGGRAVRATRRACFPRGSAVRGVFVRGICPSSRTQVADFGTHMQRGTPRRRCGPASSASCSASASRGRLQRGRGRPRDAHLARRGRSRPRACCRGSKQFTVVGIFAIDHDEIDSALALVHMRDAAGALPHGRRGSGVRLKVRDIDRAPLVARELEKRRAGRGVRSPTGRSRTRNYFRAIQIEKRMMFIILTLIIAVAAFNLVSTLVMVVTDKHPDIAILRTLGASPASIMKIFMVQGAVIGVVGTRAGRGVRRAASRSTSRHRARSSSTRSTSRSCRARCTTSASCPRTCTRVDVVVDRGACRSCSSFVATLYPELARRARESRRGAAL